MIRNLYLILVVVFRAVGLVSVGKVVIGLLFTAVIGRGTGFLFALMPLAPLLIGGVLIWLFAKPVARLITSGLDEN